MGPRVQRRPGAGVARIGGAGGLASWAPAVTRRPPSALPFSFREVIPGRVCCNETCYFELDRDITIDAEQHEFGFGGLTGQVGRDNYNLRHVNLGVNLVGTGLLDCSTVSSASCYGSAFLEYDLEHVAFNAAIVDYDRQTHCFNFAMGAVRSGKALAAERYITLPLSSADESLLAQPAFRKTELFGRPLSGLYKLRIRDTPPLVWDNLEDVQLILGYRYWSRVDVP